MPKSKKLTLISILLSTIFITIFLVLYIFNSGLDGWLPFEKKSFSMDKSDETLEFTFAQDYEQGFFELSKDYSIINDLPDFESQRSQKSLENYFFYRILSIVHITFENINSQEIRLEPRKDKVSNSSLITQRQKVFQSMLFYTKGIEQRNNGNFAKAIYFFNSAIGALGSHQDAHFQRILSLYDLKNKKQADQDVSLFMRLYPYSWQAIYFKGEIAYQKKNFVQANRLFKVASLRGKNVTVVFKRFADSFFRLKQYNNAALHYQSAARLAKMNPRFYYLAGLAFYRTKKADLAEKSYLASIQVNRKYYEANLKLAELYFKQKKFSSSKKYYVYAMTLRPKSARAYNGYGMLNMKLKEFEQAIVYFRQALLFKKNNHFYLNNLGLALENAGYNDEALDKYNLAIKVKPNYTKSYLNKAILCEKIGKFQDAEQALSQYKKLKREKVPSS